MFGRQFTDTAINLDSAKYLISKSIQPPLESDDKWQEIEFPLPSGNSSNSRLVFWFKFNLASPTNQVPNSLYFYRYNQSIQVYLNEVWVGGDVYRENRHTIAWNRPLLIPLRETDWKPGNNELLIRFQATHFGGTFAPAKFGKHSELKKLYDARVFRQHTLNLWFFIFGFFTGILSLALWLLRRQEKNYLLFAGISFCWMVVTSHMIVYHFPVSYRIWLPFVHMAIDVWIVLMYIFLSRLLDLPSPKTKRLLVFLLVPIAIWHSLTIPEYWHSGAYYFHLIGLLFIVYASIRIIYKAYTTGDRLTVFVAFAISTQIAFFAHDWIRQMIVNSDQLAPGIHLSQFAFPFMQLVFVATLLVRFTNALSHSEILNQTLEARIEESATLLDKAYKEQRQLEIKEAEQVERIRIYRELHDEVGSKLLSIVHSGRDTRLGTLANEALISLRNSVSKANNPDQPVSSLLETLKAEAEVRFVSSGHSFRWTEPDMVADSIVLSNVAFNLNRIFKELVSNIIRHANASEVDVRIEKCDGNWVFTIRDDGNGFDNSVQLGSGISNINARVNEIGGSIKWRTSPGAGVQVTLSAPLEQDLNIKKMN